VIGSRRARLAVALAAGVLAVAVAIAASAALGAQPISLSAAFAGRDPDASILFSLRLPRALLAALVGCALAAAGTALQALLRNPLAEPYVLGVSGGSALGATLGILVGLSGATALGASLIPLAALGGGLLATLLVHAFAAAAPGSRATSVLLAGVIVNAIASAGITFVKTLVSQAKAQELLFWLMGSLDAPLSMPSLIALAVYVALGIAFLLAEAARLNVLSLGDQAAEHLGVRVRAVEIRTLVASSLVVGAIVSVTGLIGFIGLLVPHVLRRLVGPDARVLMPSAIGFGGAALVVCDLLSRASFRWIGTEPPVGALTALLGGPLFLVLLRRGAAR
jgi:iron complex transport system permease protein